LGVLRIRPSILASLAIVLSFSFAVYAQGSAETTNTLIIMPFENASGAPGLQWISEAFPEILSQRLAGPTVFTLTRDDRLRAYERAEIPAEVLPPGPNFSMCSAAGCSRRAKSPVRSLN